MRILIATGIYPPDIGGPAQYARGVEEVWKKAGYTVKVLAFRFERKLPTGIRHLYFFLRVLLALPGTDFIFSPDTFSAAVPATIAAKLFGKKIIIRTGGDFLWEQYVERTGELVLLKNFYHNTNYETDTNVRTKGFEKKLNRKERMIFRLLKFLFAHADAVVFSTAWQRDIFQGPYQLDLKKCFIVENFYAPAEEHSHILKNVRMSSDKIFVGGVRALNWKNLARLEEAFTRVRQQGLPVELQLQTGSRGKFLEDIAASYAVILVSLGDVSPNTILEAISLGKPFILTRETGLYEKLKDIGVWVDSENVDDIAAKIVWLSDEHNYKAQQEKIKAFTFRHSWENIVEEIMDIYARIKS